MKLSTIKGEKEKSLTRIFFLFLLVYIASFCSGVGLTGNQLWVRLEIKNLYSYWWEEDTLYRYKYNTMHEYLSFDLKSKGNFLWCLVHK